MLLGQCKGTSKGFHTLAAIGSNGVWFITQLMTVGNFLQILKTSDWQVGLGLALYYTFFTVVGSVSMHHISMKYFEKGKRSVGGFDWSKLTIEQKQEFAKLVAKEMGKVGGV